MRRVVSAHRTVRAAPAWVAPAGRCRPLRRGLDVASRRQLHVAPVLQPPLILTGLFLALWTWKCAMMVLFQNAIIYNPYLPPNSRTMTIEEYARRCREIKWREERIRSLDGTQISLVVSEDILSKTKRPVSDDVRKRVYILYFQGNASSLPPRLPDLSFVLRRLQDNLDPARITMVCLSYRGYWTSHDRPYEEGINKDAESALQWITERHRNSNTSDLEDPVLVLWGQSIGCGFATNLAASTSEANLRINALVLETPFTSTRDMLTALYPQKWLPYQHLWPFLRNHLDSWSNFGIIAKRPDPPAIHMIIAGKDELVPADHGVRLLKRGQDVGLSMELRKVEGALHNEAIARIQGKSAIAQSITSAITGSRSCDSRVVKPREDPGR